MPRFAQHDMLVKGIVEKLGIKDEGYLVSIFDCSFDLAQDDSSGQGSGKGQKQDEALMSFRV